MRVVIVGAGPAGLVSALNLIQEGISPVILEKQSVIRSTACGEACDLQSLNNIPFNSNQYICKKVKGAKLAEAIDEVNVGKGTPESLSRRRR